MKHIKLNGTGIITNKWCTTGKSLRDLSMQLWLSTNLMRSIHRRRLSGSRITRRKRFAMWYWEKIPARSLVSSDTFDSVRWFRKYDTTSRPRPFGARPSLKSSASGGHTYFTAVYAAWYTNEWERDEGGKVGKKRKKSPIKRTCNTEVCRLSKIRSRRKAGDAGTEGNVLSSRIRRICGESCET